jgi:hypothetical protein
MCDDNFSPGFVLALGAATALVIAAVLWGLAQLPPALGAAAGSMAAVAPTGFGTAGAIASWVPTAGSFGRAAGGQALPIMLF